MSTLAERKESMILDPIQVFEQQLKDKQIKKSAIEEVATIALALSPQTIKNQLVPLLIKTFVSENIDTRIVIVRSMASLIQFLGPSTQCFVVLEFILDVLCVFSQEQLRRQAFSLLDKLMDFIDLRLQRSHIIKVIEELSCEPDKNIRQLVLKLTRYLLAMGDSDNEKYLTGIIQTYKQNEEGQILLVSELNDFIRAMLPFPQAQVHALIQFLMSSASSKVRSKIINPLIALTKVIGEERTKEYFSMLLSDTSNDVLVSVILQVRDISLVFSQNLMAGLLELIDKFQTHDIAVKNAILQVLEFIPLTAERRGIILTTNNFKYLNLSKTLATSLCKVHDITALTLLIDNSDTDFKIKLFPKLPPTCQIHIKLMEHIFAQKNWRSKLTLLQNIERRVQNEENVEILIPLLLQQLGDKIAVFRMAVIRLVSTIIKARKMHVSEIGKQLTSSSNSRNWFERQAVLLLIELLAKDLQHMSSADKSLILGMVRASLTDKVENMRMLGQSINKSFKLHIKI